VVPTDGSCEFLRKDDNPESDANVLRDNVGDKPWVDAATNAQWTFWDAASKWLPTWGEGDTKGMTVKSVKMWQQGKCGAAQDL
jgi:hypothetical protein